MGKKKKVSKKPVGGKKGKKQTSLSDAGDSDAESTATNATAGSLASHSTTASAATSGTKKKKVLKKTVESAKTVKSSASASAKSSSSTAKASNSKVKAKPKATASKISAKKKEVKQTKKKLSKEEKLRKELKDLTSQRESIEVPKVKEGDKVTGAIKKQQARALKEIAKLDKKITKIKDDIAIEISGADQIVDIILSGTIELQKKHKDLRELYLSSRKHYDDLIEADNKIKQLQAQLLLEEQEQGLIDEMKTKDTHDDAGSEEDAEDKDPSTAKGEQEENAASVSRTQRIQTLKEAIANHKSLKEAVHDFRFKFPLNFWMQDTAHYNQIEDHLAFIHIAAIAHDKAWMAELLSTHQARVNQADRQNADTPLHILCLLISKQRLAFKAEAKRQENIDESMKSVVGFKSSGKPAGEVFHCNREALYLAVTKYLLSNKANVKAVNKYGETPMHIAAESGCLALCELLLKAGADVNSLSKEGKSAFHIAVYHGNTAVVQLLLAAPDTDAAQLTGVNELETRSDTDVRNLFSDEGQTALHLVVKALDEEVIVQSEAVNTISALLASSQLHVDAVNAYQQTALHLAAFAQSVLPLCFILLKNGANADSCDPRGVTPQSYISPFVDKGMFREMFDFFKEYSRI